MTLSGWRFNRWRSNWRHEHSGKMAAWQRWLLSELSQHHARSCRGCRLFNASGSCLCEIMHFSCRINTRDCIALSINFKCLHFFYLWFRPPCVTWSGCQTVAATEVASTARYRSTQLPELTTPNCDRFRPHHVMSMNE